MLFGSGRHKILFGLGLLLALSAAGIYFAPHPDAVRQSIPERLSDTEYWSLIKEFSEPGGYFRSENFVSNESAFQRVIPTLKRYTKPGGVYLGVGPDQNFTYIAALEPKLAFIVDVRRQNMLLHLMYKALFELSGDRTDFLSRLFARPMPPEMHAANPEHLFAVLSKTPSDPDMAKATLDSILERLRDHHHFELSNEDSTSIEHVYNAFVSAGPEIRYSFPNQYAWRRFPTYSELMLETDGTKENGGEQQSYIASEENFRAIQRMESENRIVPIVGDFAGEKALRSVGQYIRNHDATVSTFYTSNVEFYLFQTEDWRKFLDTVSALPMTTESTVIRSYFNNYGLQFPSPPAWLDSPPQSYTLLDNLSSFVKAFSGGRVHTYFDVVRRSKPHYGRNNAS
jgi:hypothetical protein